MLGSSASGSASFRSLSWASVRWTSVSDLMRKGSRRCVAKSHWTASAQGKGFVATAYMCVVALSR